MLRNLGIRWQILSALALPVLVLGLISSQVTYQALVDMREASQSRELARAAGGFADLVGGLQAERALSVAVVLGQPGADKQLKSVRAAVDQGLAAIRTRVYADSSSAAVRVVLARSAVGHTSLPSLRTAVDSGKLPPRDVVTRYSQVIAADVAVPSDLAETFRTQEAATNFQQFAELSVAGEALAQEQLVGTTAILSGKANTADQRALGAVVIAGQQALATFNRTAQAEQKAALQQALGAKAARSADLAAARAAFQAAGTTGRPEVTLADWTEVTTAQSTALRGALNSINQDGIDLSTAEYDSARNKLLFTLGGAIAITLLTLLLALGLSRRISAPMRRLTLAATQIRDELPKIVAAAQTDEDYELHLPVVQIVGHNEVSRLAAAFVDVNALTVAIAREQARLRAAIADMFVNVARRNQVLLSRQLSLIDQLERNEVNPDALEELFRLDHLATRMRRNAESLLVLAGIESGRRLREPMPLSDVVRTATSEIEHYSRVSLSLAVDPPVFAHLALPIAHLLAELLENATNFSDPGSTVVVMATATNHGIRMTVADDGLGIPADELVEINARIEEPPTAEALSSQRLGFFVVGRLAQRLDAKVTLTSGRAGGTAVLIDLPSSLFVPGSLDSSFGGSLNEAITGYPDVQEQPYGSALAGIPDQGGAPAWTPEPVGALAASPFVPAFPSAVSSAGTAAGLPAQMSPSSAQAPVPTPVALPALPVAFNSAAFDAENLEPAWTPQPDNLPFGQVAAPEVEQAAPGLPARRGAAEPLAGPHVLPLPVAAPVGEPVALLINEPVNEPALVAESALVQAVAVDPITGLPVEVTPEWAESDWAVSTWATPVEEPAETVSAPAAPVAEQSGPSIFSGFRSRQATAGSQSAALTPEADLPVLDWTTPIEPVAAPMVFLDSAEAVDSWFDPEAPIELSEPDPWQAWDDVATVPTSADPTPLDVAPTATAWSDEGADGYLPPQESFATEDTTPIPSVPAAPSPVLDPTPVAWGAEPTPVEPANWMPLTEAYDPEPNVQAPESVDDEPEATPAGWAPEPIPEVWAPEPVASDPAPEVWAAEPAGPAWAPELEPAAAAWAPEPIPVPEAWTPTLEPVPVPEAWTPELEPAPWTPEPAAAGWAPEPVAEAWAPEPAPAAWTPEPAAEAWTPEPAAEAWAPEPAPAAWTPDPVAYQSAPEAWTPEPEPTAWTPEPATWTPDPQPEPRPEPAAIQPLAQTLTAAIDILPQRTSIRTALRRGRRKGDPQPTNGLPFYGGFDPIASAREFAQREGFGSSAEQAPEPAAPAEPSGVPTPSGLVPEPSRAWESASVPVERRQHPRPSDQSSQSGRSALASEALTELSRLSSYSPTSMPSSEKAGLQRRTPSDVPIDDGEPLVDSAGQRGARTAASVRSMLAGFKAGVERGRTSPAANRPALPPPPRSSSSETRDE